MLFIDMEGLAHFAADDPVESVAESVSESVAIEPVEFSAEPMADSFAPVDLEPLQDLSTESESVPSVAESDSDTDSVTDHGSAGAAEGGDLNMDGFLGFEDESAHEASPEEEPIESPGDPNSLDISRYANSEVSTAKDGPLVIKVLISGIDSKEIRQSIREAIEDSRFGWDANKLMSRINKGQLSVSGLSPVKASILITRLKRLPIQVRWEQNAVNRMEGS